MKTVQEERYCFLKTPYWGKNYEVWKTGLLAQK